MKIIRRLFALIILFALVVAGTYWAFKPTNGPTTASNKMNTAQVVDADGRTKTLPMVIGGKPTTPITGTQSNKDPRTPPVTIGSAHDKTRTNSWTALDQLYGKEDWYTRCADNNLPMDWKIDVPKYQTVEKAGTDTRFILAVNTNLTDDQIRSKAASDGNPNVVKLPIVRAPAIINTRHMDQQRCDVFIDTRSMVRVSLGKVTFDHGKPQGLEQDKGIFVDCHNMWRLPKSTPKPTPSSSTPTTPTPGKSTQPPGTTPPTTCKPPNPNCLQPKDPKQGPGYKGNVPKQVTGKNPPAAPKPEPRPSNPPSTYTPPKPPSGGNGGSGGGGAPRNPPPPETSAPKPTDPATGCVPPPGESSC